MNKSQIIAKVKNQINNNRHQAELAASLTLQRALDDVHFKANSANIAAAEIQIARLEIEGKNTETETELLRILKKDRAEILKKLKLTEADFLPNFACQKCNDSGIAGGKTCLCFKTLLHNELSAFCGGGFNKTHTFKNSDDKLFNKNENMKKAYSAMQEFCYKFPSTKHKIITFAGQVGIGKSYLVECMCNELINKDILVQFVTAFNFNNTALKFHTTFDETKNTYIDSLLDPDVLVIDDLGTEPMLNNVTKEYLFLVINDRLQSGKTTIITTNLMLSEIGDKYGERIFSRITNKANALPLNLLGEDLRLKKEGKSK